LSQETVKACFRPLKNRVYCMYVEARGGRSERDCCALAKGVRVRASDGSVIRSVFRYGPVTETTGGGGLGQGPLELNRHCRMDRPKAWRFQWPCQYRRVSMFLCLENVGLGPQAARIQYSNVSATKQAPTSQTPAKSMLEHYDGEETPLTW